MKSFCAQRNACRFQIVPVISRIMHQLKTIALLVALLQVTYACYITNCPIGGKRNLPSNDVRAHQVRSHDDDMAE